LNNTPKLLKEDSVKAVNSVKKDHLSLSSDNIDDQLRKLIEMKNAGNNWTA